MSTATQLLEQALEALIESRDDVATAIHLVPSYKADLERRVAEATNQLDKHETTIKDIEAYLAKQQAVEIDPSTLQNIAEAKRRCAAKMPCGTLVDNVYEAYEAGMKAKQRLGVVVQDKNGAIPFDVKVGDKSYQREGYIANQSIPLDTQILAITTAYEQGFGKGESRADVTCPYTAGDWLGLDIAWNLGHEEGRSKPAKQQVEQEPVGYVTLDGEFVATSPTVQKHGLDCGKNLYTSLQAREPMSDDEKRYQYLRNRPLDTITSGGVFAGLTPENIVLNGDDLDKHIDDAIEAHHGIGIKP
jgi:hypothetical protein